MIRFIPSLLIFLLLVPIIQAEESKTRSCRLIVEATSGKIIVREGPCEIRRTPASTFKIPLAVMGFDSGIFQDELHPLWEYRKAYAANRPEEQQATDPTSWMKNSVIWYSQQLTLTLGMPGNPKVS